MSFVLHSQTNTKDHESNAKYHLLSHHAVRHGRRTHHGTAGNASPLPVHVGIPTFSGTSTILRRQQQPTKRLLLVLKKQVGNQGTYRSPGRSRGS
jgi:hypothetical protein